MEEKRERQKTILGSVHNIPERIDNARFNVEWRTKESAGVCDLDLEIYCYDERGRFFEKLDVSKKFSMDGSSQLTHDIGGQGSGRYLESFKINFPSVDKNISAMLLFLDGGPRNFQLVQHLTVTCLQLPSDKSSDIYLPNSDDFVQPLFSFRGRVRKDYYGLALCILYKQNWAGEKSLWACKVCLEPLFMPSPKEKDEKCGLIVVSSVPSLEKFRPRLFAHVRDICNALSSRSLPRLKKKVPRCNGELPPVGSLHRSFIQAVV